MKYHKIIVAGALCACISLSAKAQDQNELCIPQFVAGTSEDGSRWETTLMFVNQQEADVTSQWSFFNATGQPVGYTVREQLGLGDETTIDATGQFAPTPFTAGAGRSFRFSSEEALQPGFVVITSSAPLTAHGRLHLLDAEGNLVNETTFTPGANFQSGTFFVDTTDDRLTGLAITNTSQTATATCTMQLFREGEPDQVGEDVTVTLAPLNQNSQMLQEAFTAAGFLEDEAGYVVINCDQPVCALAMEMRGMNISQIPISTAPLATTPTTPTTP